MKNIFLKTVIIIFCALTISNINAQCSAGFTYSLNANGNVSFTSTSTSASLSATSYTWDYGDNSPGAIGSVTTTSHNYSNGTYIVMLTIATYSPAYCTNTISQTITISSSSCSTNIVPVVSSTDNGSGNFSFTSGSINTSTNAIYHWNFGDSNYATGISVNHTYSVSGNIGVQLAIYDGPCSDSATSYIWVNATSCTVVPAFTYSYNTAGQFYQFTNTSTGTIAATSYTWSFGDNVQDFGTSPAHSYAASGVYTIELHAHNTVTCTVITTQTINAIIATGPCTLSANYGYTVGTGGIVDFSSTSTGTNISSNYYWNFGDGHTGGGSSPTYTYNNAGIYNVKLYVTTGSCTDTIIQSVNVTGLPCLANSNFTMALTSTPGVWNAVPLSPWVIVAASWDWGDNSTSNTLYATHSFSAAGVYSICLSATVSCGSSSSSCDSTYIYRMTQNAQMLQVNVVNPPLISVGIKNVKTETLDYAIYPNPNNGQFELKLNGNGNETAKIKVYNVIGKLVYETETINDDSVKNINMENVSNGIYFIKVNANNKEFTKKIIVSK